MRWTMLVSLAIGLSMDALAVSVGKGIALKKVSVWQSVWVGLWFGAFQAFMPMLGYLLGVRFAQFIQHIDHWIAFGLLSFIGLQMMNGEAKEGTSASLSCTTMLALALATSMDALAVGVTFAFLQVHMFASACWIGLTTFVLSSLGVKLGARLGATFSRHAQQFGGGLLLLLGSKILIEHLWFS